MHGNLLNRIGIAFLFVIAPCLARAAEPVDFSVSLQVVRQELNPGFCWFHPRPAAIPGAGANGGPLVLLTLQKHLVADDHYSGLSFMLSKDLGKSWSEPELPRVLDWRKNDRGETIAVCDVTPGWHRPTKKVLAVGIQLRYSEAGAQLLDRPRSYDAAYAVYDPHANQWSGWKTLDMPRGADDRFFQVAPGCAQWLVRADGSVLIPLYFQGPKDGPYSVTVVEATFDGTTLRYVRHGDQLSLPRVRGLVEPSLTYFQGRYLLTLRNDERGYVAASDDGLAFRPIQPWTFDDDSELGSYNTQQHWVTHHDGLFLAYTRRGANNDHIARNRAPLFLARVDPKTLRVIRRTEKVLIPERGVMLGNFGAAAISAEESWVTDSEFMERGEKHARGADGSTYVARVRWSRPNALDRLIPPALIAK